MTGKNNRAKKDARERQRAIGEKYTAARRHTRRRARQFIDDSCANCLQPMPEKEAGLFCSELCQQMAKTVRYWRRIARDGRIRQPDVDEAMRTRIAHLLAGGYHAKARRLDPKVRQMIVNRDLRCQGCGKPGEQIDHIDGDSPDPSNLQWLCGGCHQAKTMERMSPAGPEAQRWVQNVYLTRVAPDEPTQLCDDEQRWEHEWRGLKYARRDRLYEALKEEDLDPRDYRTRAEMVDDLNDQRAEFAEAACEDDEWDAWERGSIERPGSDDSGYGPFSYFAHAMAKDD